MTVAVGFTANRSSPSVSLSGLPGTQPVLRGISALADANNVNSVFVTWPAGTIAGDMGILFAHQGYDSNPPSGWTIVDRTSYGGSHGGLVAYKVLDAADITAGGATVNYTGTWWGGAFAVVYQDGASLSLGIIARASSTGGAPSGTMAVPYFSDNAQSYMLFGSGRDGNVTFTVATPDLTQSNTNRYLAFAELSPSSDSSISEAINWASSGNGYYGILVAITKDAPGGGVLLVANSSAISVASEITRHAVGALYFETDIVAKAGTPSVGIVDTEMSFGAATLGVNTNSVAYNSDGTVKINNATLATISAWVAGDNVSVAFHPGAQLIWFRVNGGSWNNDGTANPATFVGGISTSTFVFNRTYPAVGFSVGGSSIRGRFAAADFVYSAPSGYNSVEETVVTIANAPDHDIWGLYGDLPEDDMTYYGMHLPENDFSRAVTFPAGPIKLIAGEVQEDGVGVEGRLVRLYNKRTGDYVGEALTDSGGNFIIPAQDPNLPHFVVAFDDPEYNAKVYDNVLPG